MKGLYVLLLVIAITGCAPRASTRLASSEETAPRSGPVCILRAPLPENVESKTIGYIKASNRTYGSVSAVLVAMAEDARKIGADAVVSVKAGQRFGAFAWARPVAEGTAVTIANKESFDCIKLGGDLR